LEKEEALRVLEEELKKREAELGAQSDNPPSKPKKRPNPLNSEARKLFEEHYQALFSSSYYWSAKDAGNMSSLLKKLKFQREKKNLPIDDQGVLNALKYLLDSITDGWILENFSVTNINSKFNEIVSQIMAKKNGQTTSNTTVVTDRLNNRRTSSGTDAENKRREREHLGHLADAILQQSAAQNVNDVFDSPSCSIAVMNKEFGETHLRGFMVKVLNDLIDFFNVGKSIGAVQVAQTVDLIIDEYYFFKPDDFKLCFNRAKKGLYGKVYDRIDGAVILEWLGRYEKERGAMAMDDSINNSKSWDIPEGDRTSKTLEQAYHEFRKYDFERKYKV